jgi:hypothetical protein
MICSVSDGLYQGRLDCIVLLLDLISLFVEAAVLSGKIFPLATSPRVLFHRRAKKL